MGVRGAFATLIGALQSVVGFLTFILAYLIYYNPDILRVRDILNIQEGYIPLFILTLAIVSFFSIISGLLIIYEWTSTKEDRNEEDRI